jgi:hypothetical protein
MAPDGAGTWIGNRFPGDGARRHAETDDLLAQRVGNPLLIDPPSACRAAQ